MKTAKEFLKKMRFVEELDSELSADREAAAKLDTEDKSEDVIPAKTLKPVDGDDDHILAVMNGYFQHINELDTDAKGAELQDLVHRMANTMLNMPQGEKALRNSLKGAIKGLGAGVQPVQEDKSQVLEIQSKIDGLKKQVDDEKVKLNADPKGSGAGASKKKIADLNDQLSQLADQKKDAAKNEARITEDNFGDGLVGKDKSEYVDALNDTTNALTKLRKIIKKYVSANARKAEQIVSDSLREITENL